MDEELNIYFANIIAVSFVVFSNFNKLIVLYIYIFFIYRQCIPEARLRAEVNSSRQGRQCLYLSYPKYIPLVLSDTKCIVKLSTFVMIVKYFINKMLFDVFVNALKRLQIF